jgi:hypothetical protein
MEMEPKIKKFKIQQPKFDLFKSEEPKQLKEKYISIQNFTTKL